MPFPRILPSPALHATGLAALLACLCGPAASAGFDTQVQVSGTLRYPDTVEGNTNSVIVTTPPNPIIGPKSASATDTRTGTDANNVRGTSTFDSSIAAGGGLLQGSASSQVTNGTVAPYLLQGYFPHGEAIVNSTARWVDSITLFDSSLALGAPLAVDLFLHITSNVAYTAFGGSDYNHGDSTLVYAGFALDGGGGSVSASIRTTGNGLNGQVQTVAQNDQQVTLNFRNGDTIAFTANVQVHAEATLGSAGIFDMMSSTMLDASVLTTLSRSVGLAATGASSIVDGSVSPTFTAIGASGHNYLPSAVPEPGSAWLMGLGGLGIAALSGLRRRAGALISR